MTVCRKCNRDVGDNFAPSVLACARNGSASECRECANERKKEWARRNPEKRAAHQRRWYARRGCAAQRRWRAENPERAKENRRRQDRKRGSDRGTGKPLQPELQALLARLRGEIY